MNQRTVLRLGLIVTMIFTGEVIGAPFDTIININSTRDEIPSSIDSHTQLNVYAGALPDNFRAGNPDGTSVNIEVNFSGRRADKIDAYGGSVVNLTDGFIWGDVSANSGSTVNISHDA